MLPLRTSAPALLLAVISALILGCSPTDDAAAHAQASEVEADAVAREWVWNWIGSYKGEGFDETPIPSNAMVIRPNGTEDPARTFLIDLTVRDPSSNVDKPITIEGLVGEVMSPNEVFQGRARAFLPDGRCGFNILLSGDRLFIEGGCSTGVPESFIGVFR
jgi:hypothetical protein